MKKKTLLTTRKIVLVGLLAALTVAGSAIRITVPLDIAGTSSFHFHGPFYRINPHIDTSAMFVNIPTGSICSLLGINGHNYTLASKFVSRLTDEIWSLNGRTIN